MAKILLVEDDQSLREIYSIRLTAEGFEIVSASDGEEALALAVKEKPDLILSDVMMPKISGFDMLDILRSTPETKDVRVIMMTALSSEDQRERGEKLGADRYLVKSQVGIEDVVNAVHDVLGDLQTAVPVDVPATNETATAPGATAPAPEAAQPVAEPVAAPVAPTEPVAPAEPVAEPVQPVEPAVTTPNATVVTSTDQPVHPAAPISEQQPPVVPTM
jgi:DNA-binding response OmpR family regulator